MCFPALILMECYWKIPWRVFTNSPQANFPFFAEFSSSICSITTACYAPTAATPKTPVFIWVFQINVNLIYVSGVRYNSHYTVYLLRHHSSSVAGCVPAGSTTQRNIVMRLSTHHLSNWHLNATSPNSFSHLI